jgi:hypothetical protein
MRWKSINNPMQCREVEDNLLEIASFKPVLIDRVSLRADEFITDRVEGKAKQSAAVTNAVEMKAERQRFEAAIDLLVEEYGISRAEAGATLVSVEPSFKKFLEPEADSL